MLSGSARSSSSFSLIRMFHRFERPAWESAGPCGATVTKLEEDAFRGVQNRTLNAMLRAVAAAGLGAVRTKMTR